MTLYLKGSQKYDKSKMKVLLLLSEFRSFNFDLSYFLRLSCDSALNIHEDVLKSGNLLYKWGFGDSQSSTTVHVHSSCLSENLTDLQLYSEKPTQ